MRETIKKLRIGLLGLIGLSIVLGSSLYRQQIQSYPQIDGAVIPDGRSLAPFELQDQFGKVFSNKDLSGQWHLVSYGYTHCPDICPTTLQVLTAFKNRLEAEARFNDLQVLFYSIDHQRDTATLLREYMPFFHPDFVGLTMTKNGEAGALAFEKSLGMKLLITPLKASERNEFSGDYSVSHGVMLYLLNPQGKLQAVMQPSRNAAGIQQFTQEKLHQDYVALREYFG